MWHVTFDPHSGKEAERQFTKCLEATVHPPTGVCLVCDQIRMIAELKKKVAAMHDEMKAIEERRRLDGMDR